MASRRYTYSRTINTVEGVEKFEAHEWDSFDEAKAAVERGINDRKLQIEAKYPRLAGAATIANSVPLNQTESIKSDTTSTYVKPSVLTPVTAEK